MKIYCRCSQISTEQIFGISNQFFLDNFVRVIPRFERKMFLRKCQSKINVGVQIAAEMNFSFDKNLPLDFFRLNLELFDFP